MAGTTLATWELREFISAMGSGRHCAVALQSGSPGEGAAEGLEVFTVYGAGGCSLGKPAGVREAGCGWKDQARMWPLLNPAVAWPVGAALAYELPHSCPSWRQGASHLYVCTVSPGGLGVARCRCQQRRGSWQP